MTFGADGGATRGEPVSVTPDADGLLETAILVDTAVSQSGGGAPPAGSGACTNCGTARSGSYCPTCGQKAVPLNPTLKYFLHEVAHELLNVDGKIFRSVRLLVTRPGFLTKEILAGRRASYVLPLRLYLIFSILAFALGAADSARPTIQYIPSPGEIVDPQVQLEMEQRSNAAADAVATWLPRAMFVLVPLFAALVMLVRPSSGLNYPQHLYFALHVQAFYFFMRSIESASRVVGVPNLQGAVFLVTALVAIGYFVAAFRAVYGTTVWGSVWRCAVVIALYFVALVVTVFAITLPWLRDVFTGGAS